MGVVYYTVEDVRGVSNSLLQRLGRCRRAKSLEEAIQRYRKMPCNTVKALYLRDEEHTLELVECVPVAPAYLEGEDVLAVSDMAGLSAEAAEAIRTCIDMLSLRYKFCGDAIIPICEEDELPRKHSDKLLWLSVEKKPYSAIRWAYVAGVGWVSPGTLQDMDGYRPIVTELMVELVTNKGEYVFEKIGAWEYELLLERTLQQENRAKEVKEHG